MNDKSKQLLLCLYISLFFSFTSLAQTTKGIKVVSTESPSSANIVQGNTYALIVGISKYQSSAIPQLNYADADAKAFHDFLISTAGGKVPEGNILMLLNDEARIGDIMMKGVPWLESKAKKGDRVFIYFSGHGITIGNNDSYLLANDIKEGFNKNNIFFSGGVPVIQLKRNTIQPMTATGVEVFLVIDACRSKAVANERDSVKLLTSSALSENAGDIMLISAENEQSSEEDNPTKQKWGGHGVFTYYLLNGLEGMADGMGDRADGIITLGELKNYLSNKVPESTDYLQAPYVSEGHNQVALCKVDAPTLAALKQKLQQSGGDLTFAPNTSKGVVANDADATAKSAYTLFSQALSKGKLLGDSSADYYFTKLENYSHAGSLKQDALYSLCAALMNDGQRVINAYLKADFKYGNNKEYNYAGLDMLFAKGEVKMNRLYELRDKYFKGNKYNENIKARWLFMKARKWANSNDKVQLDVAKEAIEQAIKIDSMQAYFYHTLALIYSMSHNPKMGLLAEQKALMIYNNWVIALSGTARMYYALSEFDKAEEYYHKAFQADSTYKEAYFTLGSIYMYLKQPDKAEQTFLKFIQVDSTDKSTYLNIAAIYIAYNKYDKAEQYCFKAIQLDSTYKDAYLYLGITYANLKQYDKADQHLLKALSFDPRDSNILYDIACCYSLQMKKEGALKYLEQSIQNGWNDYDHIKGDTDLDNIRNEPEFRKLMAKYFPDKSK